MNSCLGFIVKEANHGVRNQIKSLPLGSNREFIIGLIMRQECWVKAADFSQIPNAQEKAASGLAVHSVSPQRCGVDKTFPIHGYPHFVKASIGGGILLG